MSITALFFDVGNTLLFPNHKEMLRALHERQIFPSRDLLQKIERQTKREFDTLQESHASVDHGFWQIYYSHLLEELGCADDAICTTLVSSTQVSAFAYRTTRWASPVVQRARIAGGNLAR